MSDQVLRIHPIETLERHRDHDFTLQGYQSDLLTPAALGASDVVRFKIWNDDDVDASPTIDIDSVALDSGTVTADDTTDLLSLTDHGFTAGQRVRFSSSGTLPAGLSAGVVYHVLAAGLTADAFAVGLTAGGVAVDITDTGTGTHTVTRALSTITIDALGVEGDTPFEVTVKLERGDVNELAAGEWNWEASVVKTDDNNRCFPFARGTFDVVDNAAGDLGVT